MIIIQAMSPSAEKVAIELDGGSEKDIRDGDMVVQAVKAILELKRSATREFVFAILGRTSETTGPKGPQARAALLFGRYLENPSSEEVINAILSDREMRREVLKMLEREHLVSSYEDIVRRIHWRNAFESRIQYHIQGEMGSQEYLRAVTEYEE